MERILVILENKGGLGFAQARGALEKLRSMGLNVNDLRVDFNHIEVDLSGGYEGLAEALGEKIILTKPIEEEGGDAKSLVCSGRFWEAHEALEGPWRTLKGEEAESYRKAILFCAAMVHMQRGDADGFKRILERAVAIRTEAVIVERCIEVAVKTSSEGPEGSYARAREACSVLC